MVVHRSADAEYFDLHREDESQIKRLSTRK
jgi:hypothetical protein